MPLTSLVRRRGCLLLPLAIFLGGCASLITPPAPAPDGVALRFHPAIELGGRLSVRYQQNGRDESVQGGFRWSQDGQRIDVALLSPLNQTMASIAVTPDAATLTEAGKPPRSAPDIDTLSTLTFGWTLPVSGLRGWLQGFHIQDGKTLPIAVPGVTNAPPVATSDGWQVSYVSWQTEEATGRIRPRRIDLQRRTPELGEMAIRIVIDSWQIR